MSEKPEFKVIQQPDFTGYKIPDKRFYLPGCILSSDCPKCSKEVIQDFTNDYIAYPVSGKKDLQYFYCADCDEEWSAPYQLTIEVKLEPVP